MAFERKLCRVDKTHRNDAVLLARHGGLMKDRGRELAVKMVRSEPVTEQPELGLGLTASWARAKQRCSLTDWDHWIAPGYG